MKVLIVEDEEAHAKIYGMIFCHFTGIEIIYATNGMIALEQIATHDDIVLIVLDLHMPIMDGREFLKQRKTNALDDIPVIAVSSETDPAIKKEVQLLGAIEYITKPFKGKEFKELITNVFARYSIL